MAEFDGIDIGGIVDTLDRAGGPDLSSVQLHGATVVSHGFARAQEQGLDKGPGFSR